MLDALLRKPDRSILLLPQHLIGALKLTQLIGIPSTDIWKLFGSERKRKAIQPSQPSSLAVKEITKGCALKATHKMLILLKPSFEFQKELTIL